MMKAWLELDSGTPKKTRQEKDPGKTWLYADSVNWTRLAKYYLHGANSVLSIASSHNSAEAQKK